MKKCHNCKSLLVDKAKFCHKCGAKTLADHVKCLDCGKKNMATAVYCFDCGSNLKKEQIRADYQAIYPIDFSETLAINTQIKAYFFLALRERIQEEQDQSLYGEYVKALQSTGYQDKLELRSKQLAEECYTIHCRQDEIVKAEIDRLLEINFDSMLDYFIIHDCKTLNKYELPIEILRYDQVRQGEFNLQSMIMDYLSLGNEKEDYYIDFMIMPVKKLKNASTSFLFSDRDEKIMLICDQTVFGSCKEGFALTDRAIYWKAHFNKAIKIAYQQLSLIEREKEWITINGHFFNVNPTINLRMMKLLKKLSDIY